MRAMLLASAGLAVLISGSARLDAATETGPNRLIISEFVVTPTAGEMVEIYNPNSFTVDLTDVYLTDATYAGGSTYYYQIVTGYGGGGSFGDFYARFPAGATIGAGEFQTVALNGSIGFMATFGVAPTYEIWEDDVAPDAIPDMVEATAGSIPASIGGSGLSNTGEVVILLYWDGASDLVTDLDYVVWGDKVEAVDKTGVSIDGPDADSDASTYLADTAIVDQDTPVNNQPHATGNSAQRLMLSEGQEVRSGGNGLTKATGLVGNDETSENVSQTFVDDLPTPNAAYSGNMTLVLTPGGSGSNTLALKGGPVSSIVFFLPSLTEGYIGLEGKCPGVGEGLGIGIPLITVKAFTTDGTGEINASVTLPNSPGDTMHLQAIDVTGCKVSNMNETRLF